MVCFALSDSVFHLNIIHRTMLRVQKPKHCKTCGKEFRQYRSVDKYCSALCQKSDAKPKKLSSQSLRTIDANRLFLRNKSALKNKQIIFTGYNYCENCGLKNPYFLDAHHIVFRSERPNHANLHDKINIILLCRPCHDQFHAIKETRNPILEQRNLKSIFNL
jgi:hypothetical protein